MIRTIIVEDEYHPRLTLQQKLAEYHPEIEVLAACENAESALIEILRLQPDLVFLDIQLPDKNGLWLADQLNEMSCETFTPPGIIFVTAFSESEYLFKAIRLAAVDYLVKPVMLDNLATAIDRFRKRANPSAGVQNLMNALNREKILKFKNLNGILLLKPKDIAYIEGDGNYARMALTGGEFEEIFERLGEIEQILPKDTFIRAGRSIILNKYYVRRINSKKSTVQMVTPEAAFEVEVPAGALKQLKNPD